MRDELTTEVRINYREARAEFGRPGERVGLLELCIIRRSATEAVERETGMPAETFLDGMRDLIVGDS